MVRTLQPACASAIRFDRGGLARAIAVALASAPLLLPQVAVAQDVDLANLGDRGFRIDGIDSYDRSGNSVSAAGDVNGDGLTDLIVGAFGANGDAGQSYVVFGKSSSSVVDLDNLGSGGFRIDGIDSYDRSGNSVAGAGDVNGDGLDDLIVGATGADPGGNNNAGESYVVFGKTDGTTVDLGNLGGGGFRIDGIDAGDSAGRVAAAGDVNGDGLADLIIGAPNADPDGRGNAGESYVVFGKASSTTVDLSSLGSGGFQINGIDDGDNAGRSVAGAGDVNGDGLADLIIGAYRADPDGDDDAGESYVVFGKASSTAVDLSALGSGGFQIDGIAAGDLLGGSVAGAGDVNGDGLADLIIGADFADPGGVFNAGQSYVVFGKADSTPVDLANLGSSGFRMDGIDASDYAGRSVSGAGDVNGDGLADLIVGAYGADPGNDFGAGESYVVFGKATSTVVDLGNLGSGGFRIDGIDFDDSSGQSVAVAGDVNGDGLADLIVGAPSADPGGDNRAGESYVVFSAAMPPPGATYRLRSRNGNPPQSVSPDARLGIDFADGDALPNPASTEVLTLTRAGNPFPASAANVSWQLQTTRQNWSSAEVTVRYLASELLIGDESALELVFSPNGNAPFTALPSVVNPLDNTISANLTELGFLYIGQHVLLDAIFGNGFE